MCAHIGSCHCCHCHAIIALLRCCLIAADAAKDFWDAQHGRRINWGWAPLYTNSLALPRDVRYDPRLQQLVFSPLEEQALLRTGTIVHQAAVPLKRGVAARLRASAQAEVELIFDVPNEAAVLCANLTAPSSTHSGGIVDALSFQINYTPPPRQQLGNDSHSAYHTITVVGASDAKPPSAATAATNGSAGSSAGGWSFSSELRLLPDEKQLTLRLFFDHTIVEAYWQERVAMTLPLSTVDWEGTDAELALSTTTTGFVVKAQVWSVGSMWVAPREILAQDKA